MKYMIYGHGNALEQCTYSLLLQTLPKSDQALFAMAGNSALLAKMQNVYVVKTLDDAISLATDEKVDLVILLSPVPLMAGVADAFQKAGFDVFGLPQNVTKLESSKAFGKQFMRDYAIPCADSFETTNLEEAKKFLELNWQDRTRQYVIKSDSFDTNASKRVILPSSLDEAVFAVEGMLNSSRTDSSSVVIEERLYGSELSVHVFFDGKSYHILPQVSDFKRLLDRDRGPNTQGVGALATTNYSSADLLTELRTQIIEPTLEGIQKTWDDYRYILYIGVIATESGLKVLEFNTRPGSPEWIALLQLLDSPLNEIINAIQQQKLSNTEIKWKQGFGGALFALSYGYPLIEREYFESIVGVEKIDETVEVYGDGIKQNCDRLEVNGGRVLAVAGFSQDINSLRNNIYENICKVRFNGMFYRSDLGLTSPVI
ncbi:phosphoribosylamine--glycine ligase [Calothrix sp. NIES-2098]|uniref:phosphoribosylamine--glycine ligase n=1 Tax=Calothrix sp. NIES-2098 TaxID=1954171 RepID=UPI000B61FCE9|nr:phosphoribosylglycinamide synthetase [Calothrix sp. NIES-2098]